MSIKWDSFTNTVAGKQVNSDNKHQGINPATGEELWTVPIASQQDVDAAVESATMAFETFRFVPVEKRKELLQKYCDLWTENAEEMINLLCKETGKPVSQYCDRVTARHLLIRTSVNSLRWKSIWSPPSSSTSWPFTSPRSVLRTRRKSSPPVTPPSVSLVPFAPGKHAMPAFYKAR
jgi:acyl-CoA reductase-like NAD-dependent aldehyde dehydrogenase